MKAYRKPNASYLLNKFFMRTHRNTRRELEQDLRRQGWRRFGPFFIPDKRKGKP